MDWGRPYTSKWRVMRVDPNTWADTSELQGVTSVSISKDATDAVPLLQTGAMNVDIAIEDNFESGWYRIEMLATQFSGEDESSKEVGRYPIATLLFESTSDVINRNNKNVSLNGSSTLKPVSDMKMVVGTYAPKGVNGAQYCADLIAANSPAPVVIDDEDGGFILNDHVVFDSGMSYLESAWLILDAAGWCMQIDGLGQIHILEKPMLAEFNIDRLNARMLGPEISTEEDLSAIPNRYYVSDGDETVVVINDDDDSPTSFQNRGGRWVDYIDTYPVRMNGETLTAYANRMMTAASTIFKKKTYSREYMPGLEPFDLVQGSLFSAGLTEEMRILSQDLTCGIGIFVAETSGIEEVIYEA